MLCIAKSAPSQRRSLHQFAHCRVPRLTSAGPCAQWARPISGSTSAQYHSATDTVLFGRDLYPHMSVPRNEPLEPDFRAIANQSHAGDPVASYSRFPTLGEVTRRQQGSQARQQYRRRKVEITPCALRYVSFNDQINRFQFVSKTTLYGRPVRLP